MNRRKFIVTAGALSTLGLAGCTSEGEPSNGAQKATETTSTQSTKASETTTETETETETTTTTVEKSKDTRLTLAFGETAKLENGIHVTVESVEFRSSYDSSGYEETPADGMKFAFVSVVAENKGEKAEYLPMPMDITLLANGDQISDYMYFGSDAYEIDSGKTQPGLSEKGFIAYEVPEDLETGDLEIQWYLEDFDENFNEVIVDVRWSK